MVCALLGEQPLLSEDQYREVLVFALAEGLIIKREEVRKFAARYQEVRAEGLTSGTL